MPMGEGAGRQRVRVGSLDGSTNPDHSSQNKGHPSCLCCSPGPVALGELSYCSFRRWERDCPGLTQGNRYLRHSLEQGNGGIGLQQPGCSHPAVHQGPRTPSAVQGSGGERRAQAERRVSPRLGQPPASSAADCSLAWEVQATFIGWPRQIGGHDAHWDWVGVVHGAGTEMFVLLEDAK